VPPEAPPRASKQRFISMLGRSSLRYRSVHAINVWQRTVAAGDDNSRHTELVVGFVNPGSKNQSVLRCRRLSDSKSLSAFRISSETVSRFSCVSSPSVPLGPRHQRIRHPT